MALNLIPSVYAAELSLLTAVRTEILQPIVGVLFAAAVLIFFWGVVEFIAGAENPKARDLGKQHMIWGVVGLFIMVSVNGILNLICDTINC
ncbi:MAG TPA: hypothetical protein VEB60_03250 [Candidatus Paceibacterota bacterium]|nr:hypothetical protein [Candidatus Paceibacterota bacterium]